MKKNILIIDNSTFQRVLLINILQDYYNLEEITSYNQAIKTLKKPELNYDCIIISLTDPLVGGLELIQAIRRNNQLNTCPIIVITSGESLKDLFEAFDAGASDFLSKPFFNNVVLTRINNAIEAHDRYLEIKSQHHNLNSDNFDPTTGTLNYKTTRWLINEKLTIDPGQYAFTLYQINNLTTIDLEQDFYVYRNIIISTAKEILSHYESSDIIGRVADNKFGVFTKLKDEDPNTKAEEIVRLINLKNDMAYPQIEINQVTIIGNEEMIFINYLQNANKILTKEK